MARRVLVIDDDPKARALVAAMLEPSGCEVVPAESGSRGLILASDAVPDLFLLDVEMPGMDGYEVCRRLRQDPKTRRIPVVMLTATDDPALNRLAFAAGAQACVPKPFRREGLIAVLETVQTQSLRGEPSEGTPEDPA